MSGSWHQYQVASVANSSDVTSAAPRAASGYAAGVIAENNGEIQLTKCINTRIWCDEKCLSIYLKGKAPPVHAEFEQAALPLAYANIRGEGEGGTIWYQN